jgi:hypothetical protein
MILTTYPELRSLPLLYLHYLLRTYSRDSQPDLLLNNGMDFDNKDMIWTIVKQLQLAHKGVVHIF